MDVLWRLVHTEVELGEHRHEGSTREKLYESAFGHAEEALAADSTDPRAHLAQALAAGRLAQTVDSQGRRLELSRLMKRRAQRALALDPNSHLAHYLLGRWHFELASIGTMTRLAARAVYGGIPSASLEEAARHVRRAVELEERIAYRLTLARILRAKEELTPAAEHLAALLDLPATWPGDEHRKERARTILAEIRAELEDQKKRRGWFGISL